MIDINYIWIGPPQAGPPDDLPELGGWETAFARGFRPTHSDITGPLAMFRACSTIRRMHRNTFPMPRINFWCLDAHVIEFQQIFLQLGAAHIQVFGTGAWCREKLSSLPIPLTNPEHIEQYHFLITLLALIGAAQYQGAHAVNKIITKDFLSLIILYFVGGYTFDTNTFPANGFHSMLLPPPDAHKVLIFDAEDTPFSILRFMLGRLFSGRDIYVALEMMYGLVGGGFDPFTANVPIRIINQDMKFLENIEVWAMSSQAFDPLTRAALLIYADCVPILRTSRHKPELVHQDFTNLYTGLIASALMTGIISMAGGYEHLRQRNLIEIHRALGAALIPDNNHFSTPIIKGAPGIVSVPCLGLLKYYRGSHRVDAEESLLPPE